MLHHRLILKLKAYGICGNPHLWLSNFLSNRVQRVLVNGCSSDWVGVQSGVPQGSVLGPLLFILYVNDIPDLILSNMRMFADDTKIYFSIQQSGTLMTASDCKKTLTSCHNGLEFGYFNLMQLNVRS